jgi:hypothetical protein
MKTEDKRCNACSRGCKLSTLKMTGDSCFECKEFISTGEIDKEMTLKAMGIDFSYKTTEKVTKGEIK